MSRKTRNSFLLILTAFIWGVAFVAQSEGGDAVGAFSFNFSRSLVGSAVLVPVIFLSDKLGWNTRIPKTKEDKLTLLKGGLCCGFIMAFATNLQQLGINSGTEVGKAGFLTACYIILVPIFGMFLHKKCGWNIWVGVVLTVAGLYLLCMNGPLTLQKSDVLVLLCAVCFSLHILVIDHFSPLVDGVRLSCIQFLISGLLTSIPMFIKDIGSFANIGTWASTFNTQAWISILYAGVFSSGIAYTLQIIGQQDVNPTVASLLMSLESVFSVLAGWLLLHQHLTLKELAGCALIFVAVVLAQIGDLFKKKA